MWRAVAACCLCILAAPSPAAAEWHITPMVGITFAGKTTYIDPEFATGKIHPAIGIAGTYLTSGIVGIEAIATITPGFFQTSGTDFVEVDSSRVTAIMANVMITVPQRWAEYSLRPFVSGGFGLMRVAKTEANGVFSLTSNLGGYNIGGGAMGYFSQRTGVRFDIRYYSNVHGVDQGPVAVGEVHIRYMTATVGLVFRR
jgi:Outer membrane protein beta-barrel domain